MSRPFFFGGNPSSQQSQYLVQMKAGKMTKTGNIVSPIKEKKGLIYLHQSADDNLMHFCWKDRTSGTLEDDLIIFPDDAEFLKVPQCTTGRVFVLKFKTSPRRLFFWSQEPKDDKDDEIVSKINEYFNNPMAAANRGNTGGHNIMAPTDLALSSDEEFRNLFSNGNVSATQLISMLDAGLGVLPPGAGRLASLLGSVQNQQNSSSSSSSSRSQSANGFTPAAPQTPSTTPAIASSYSPSESSSTTGGNNSPAGLKLADLQNIISGLSGGQAGSSGSDVNIDLSSSINMEVLRPLLTNVDFMKRIADTLPQIESQRNKTLPERFTSTVQSPQFQQALSTFSQALQSGQMGPLIQQFGLPEECVAAANAGNLESFVKALQNSNKSKTTESKSDDKSKTTDGSSGSGTGSSSSSSADDKPKKPSDSEKKGDDKKKFDDDSMALD